MNMHYYAVFVFFCRYEIYLVLLGQCFSIVLVFSIFLEFTVLAFF